MSQELTKKQQDAINEVETALKKLYDAGLVLITQNGNALFYKADSYNDAVKFTEIVKSPKDLKVSEELTPKEEVDKHCSNCGEEEDFAYIRTTASGHHNKGTNHYTCNNCGEELSFVEDL